jgi:glycosyltransferase involved in cell wall biosynthesis
MISVVMINSRSDIHPDWVQLAKDSVAKQTVETELIVINNTDRKKTVGECWNEGVKKTKYDLVFFLGDDDWLTMDYLSVLLQYAMVNPNYTFYTTYMTAFDDKTKVYTALPRICTGMWRKEYLLKYPFNEKLKKGIDREYIQEMQKRGDIGFTINHFYGYYYRKHDDYSLAGKINFTKEKPQIYVLTSGRNFIDPLVAEWEKNKKVLVSTEEFNPLLADEAEVIFCEWLREDAIAASQYECKAKKILRIHSYEAFTPLIYYVDFKKFDVVIFIAEHIKDFVESKVGEIPNAVVIPVGIGINGFDPSHKIKNNKIAYAGEISRKKGIAEILLLAKELPEYEFHIAGKFNEEDVARHLNEKQPENVFIEPYSYDLPKFFEDKTYILNASLREGNPITVLEGMAHGLKPLISDWVGADEIYGKYVYKNLRDFRALLRYYDPPEYKKFAEQYDIKKTIEKINGYL